MFDQSIEVLNNPKYLGSAKVVDRMVREFVHGVMSASSENEVLELSRKAADVFSGRDSSFIQVDGWCNRGGLGAALEQYINVDGGQPFYDMVATAFLQFATLLMNALVTAGSDTPEVRAKVDSLIQQMTAILIGAGFATLGN